MSKINDFLNSLKNKKNKPKAAGNNKTKSQQYRNLIIALIGIVIVALIASAIKSNSDSVSSSDAQQQADTRDSKTIDFSNPTDHVDQQSVWIQRAENTLAKQNAVEKNIKETQESTGKQLNEQDVTVKKQQKTIKWLTSQLSDIQKELEKQNKEKEQAEKEGRMVSPAGQGAGQGAYLSGPQMEDTQINLVQKPRQVKKVEKTPENWVSPGTYVQALVLQGVDASAGVTSQSDPRPVLLRTTSNGSLPGVNNHSKLKNCRIIGSGYGDVSSERVYVRLETMSCIRNGVEHDFPVYGYIAGSDAMTGQRGPVVFRDGPFVERAFVGGVLAGIGNIGQQYSQNYSTSPLGSVSTIDPSKIPLAAAGSGFGTAGQMYAQYNIKRAEQYQPVVEFGAGNYVDIVFTKGFWLDGHKDKPDQSDSSENSQSQSNQNVQKNNQDLSTQLSQLEKAQQGSQS